MITRQHACSTAICRSQLHMWCVHFGMTSVINVAKVAFVPRSKVGTNTLYEMLDEHSLTEVLFERAHAGLCIPG